MDMYESFKIVKEKSVRIKVDLKKKINYNAFPHLPPPWLDVTLQVNSTTCCCFHHTYLTGMGKLLVIRVHYHRIQPAEKLYLYKSSGIT